MKTNLNICRKIKMILSPNCPNCNVLYEITQYNLICNAPKCDSILCLSCYEAFTIQGQSTKIGHTVNCDQLEIVKGNRRYTHRCDKYRRR